MRQFMAATFTDLILRVVLAFALSDLASSAIGIWFAWPIGWTISIILSVSFYKKNIKNMHWTNFLKNGFGSCR